MKRTENVLTTKSEFVSSPTYFLTITVANVRCFGPEQTLDLSDGQGRPARWIVLLGENGVGKTTLLQCLAAMQPVASRFIDNASEAERRVNGEAYLPRGFYDQAPQFRILFERADQGQTAPFGEGDHPLEIEAQITTMLRLGDDRSLGKLHNVHIVGSSYISQGSRIPADVSGLEIFGYGASRKSGYATITKPGLLQSCDTLFDKDAELISAEEWLLQTSYATVIGKMAQRRIAQKRLNDIKRILTSILPDVIDFRFGTSDDATMKPRVEAKTPYGWVRLAELSHGYKSALTWIVDFANRLYERYPESPNPVSEPAVVLIDEIDMHLHPRWQRELVLRLTEIFANTQFIVTAHSPLIVQAAPNANLALLRRKGDHVVIDNDVDEIRNWRVDQILTSDLFGLETARPPRLDRAYAERDILRSKPSLSEEERLSLDHLNAEIEQQTSVGENPLEIRALDALRRAASLLERSEKAAMSAE